MSSVRATNIKKGFSGFCYNQNAQKLSTNAIMVIKKHKIWVGN
jgi:hypothetical protein